MSESDSWPSSYSSPPSAPGSSSSELITITTMEITNNIRGQPFYFWGGGGGYGWFQEKNNLAMKYPGKKYLSRHIMWEKKILRSCTLGETFHLQSFWKIILTLTKSPLPPQKSKGQLLNKHSHSNFFSSGDNQYSVYQIHHGNWGNDHWM